MTGFKESEMDRRFRERMDLQPATGGCAFCAWTYTGTVAECRDAAAVHRADHHPEAGKLDRKRKRRRKYEVGSVPEPKEANVPITKNEAIEAGVRWAEAHGGQMPRVTDWQKPKKERGDYPQRDAVMKVFDSWVAFRLNVKDAYERKHAATSIDTSGTFPVVFGNGEAQDEIVDVAPQEGPQQQPEPPSLAELAADYERCKAAYERALADLDIARGILLAHPVIAEIAA